MARGLELAADIALRYGEAVAHRPVAFGLLLEDRDQDVVSAKDLVAPEVDDRAVGRRAEAMLWSLETHQGRRPEQRLERDAVDHSSWSPALGALRGLWSVRGLRRAAVLQASAAPRARRLRAGAEPG